ncbi:MAG TPA: acyl carrier protein [Bryobacteraceae bacterium]|nr:acyl carrier protein [Bryobacteraceae bacterium]
MNNISTRVSQCFQAVFPQLDATDLPRASQASIPQWDSVAHVTLLSAISEEFGIEIDDESFETLTSYLLVADFVESQVAGG